jgi:glycosyltransferase involved in cell wall biosynthesis
MVNIHLYPSWILNESRMLREARTLSRLAVFERIDLVGCGGPDLPQDQDVGGRIWIRRLAYRSAEGGLLQKIREILRWTVTVYRTYRKQPLACVNAHSISTLPLGCALKLATGARLIYDAHELETETTGLSGLRKTATKLLERALIGYVDYSIFVGAAIDDWYRQRYSLSNTAVVYNCPPLTTVARSDHFRQTFGIAPQVPIFLYHGVISKERGVPKLIEAFASLEQQAALVLMGYGDLVPWVQEQAAQRANVFYHPAVPPDQLLAHTAAADYGLSVIEPASLSYEYCMPNKLFEYLMAGKAVLVSPTLEQRTFVQQQGVGEVARTTDPPDIREAVLRLLARSPSELHAAIERTRVEFSWEKQEGVLRRIYTEQLGFQVAR